jgi:hypothetical protein
LVFFNKFTGYTFAGEFIFYMDIKDIISKNTEELLEYYGTLPEHNPSLYLHMKNNPKKREEFIRYEVWKLLPDGIKGNLTQALEEKGAENTKRVIPLKPAGEKVVERKTTARPMLHPSPGSEEDSKIVQRGALHRQRAVLSNSLKTFAEDDNAGRKKVVDQIAYIEKQMEELVSDTPSDSKYKYLKTEAEKAKMSAAEKGYYKKVLSEKKSKIKKALLAPKSERKRLAWEEELATVEREFNSL